MSKSGDAVEALYTKWEKLKAQRPTEGDFGAYGFAGLTFETFDELFARWKNEIESLEEKGLWITSPEAAIADQPISANLALITGIVTNALQHGVAWLASSNPFVKLVFDTHSQITLLTARRVSVHRNLARILAEKGEAEIEQIIAAGDIARQINQLKEQTQGHAKSIANDAALASENNDEVRRYHEEVEKLSAQIKEASAVISKTKAEIDAAHGSVAELKATAEKREAELEERVVELNDSIAASKAAADAAMESVAKALRDARDQGLASSFQKRSVRLNSERRLWGLVFVGAATILAALSITFVSGIGSLTYEALIVAFLKKAALAGPAIWVGWYAARQMARVDKVQEDYEYKAASALAFQSYKEEAAAQGDDLSKRLLEHAITTFGENPVRLYEKHVEESSSPLEALLKKVPTERAFEILASAAAKASNSPIGK